MDISVFVLKELEKTKRISINLFFDRAMQSFMNARTPRR